MIHEPHSHPHDAFAGSHPESEKMMDGDMPEATEITATPQGQVVADDGNANVLAMVMRAATDPAVDVAKMERLLTMYEGLQEKQAMSAFNTAMAEAQAKMVVVTYDKKNNQTHSDYASYAQIDRAIRPIYAKHGFALSFGSDEGAPEGYVRVVCDVTHRDGGTRRYHADMPADGKGAKGGDVMTKTHAAGSAFTYGQRYLLKLIFNVAVGDEQDDDGNAAGGVIDERQKNALIKEIQESGADTKAFLRLMNVETLDKMPAAQYPLACLALKHKREAAAKAEAVQ